MVFEYLYCAAHIFEATPSAATAAYVWPGRELAHRGDRGDRGRGAEDRRRSVVRAVSNSSIAHWKLSLV